MEKVDKHFIILDSSSSVLVRSIKIFNLSNQGRVSAWLWNVTNRFSVLQHNSFFLPIKTKWIIFNIALYHVIFESARAQSRDWPHRTADTHFLPQIWLNSLLGSHELIIKTQSRDGDSELFTALACSVLIVPPLCVYLSLFALQTHCGKDDKRT